MVVLMARRNYRLRSYYKPQIQTFNDGIVSIYKVDNIATPGNMPKDGLTIKVSNLRYEERTVGMSRFWTAKQEQAQISQLIRTPRINSVTTHDVVILNGQQYDIVQVQFIQDIEPPCMDLSLVRLEVAYEVK
jgi:hypothetical protein